MKASELLDLYQRVAKGPLGLPPFDNETRGLEARVERLTSAQAAHAALVAFEPTEGWLGFQSANRIFRSADPPSSGAATGALLAAEAVNAAGESLHVRYDGAGSWLATRYRPSLVGEYLAEDTAFVAQGGDTGKLRYRRYWRIDPVEGAMPCAACFVGFGND